MSGSTSVSTSLGEIEKEIPQHREGTPVPIATPDHGKEDVNTVDIETWEPPDGGLKAWLQVLGAFFLFFASWGFPNSFGVYQNYYTTELLKGTSSSSIAWIGSIQPFLLMFVGVLTGPLYDKGYFFSLVGTGAFLVTLGIMMTSICKEYYQFVLAQGICIGLGTGCMFVPSVAVIAGYFTMKRSFAIGLASTGGSIGGIVYSVAFRSLVDKIGFGWSTRFLGFLTMVLLMISLAMMRPMQFPARARSLWLPRAFKEPPYTLASVAFGVMFMGLYVPYFQIQGYAAELLKLDRSLSYQLLTIMNVASIFGRTVPTIVADRIGPINAMIPSGAGAAVMGFAWTGTKTMPSIIVFAVLYGFLSGTVVALPPTTIASMGGRLDEIGTRLGMSCVFAGIGLLIGNPIGGVLIDIPNGKFKGAQIYCGSTVLAGTILFLAAKLLLPRQKKKQQQQMGEERNESEKATEAELEVVAVQDNK
ncbi:hypothetical protein ABW19_dt0203208 [Dactylella cylindrospora]|nr:hypothetical protein ABW19_dt0203208 [Dactylella cylindrospora]